FRFLELLSSNARPQAKDLGGTIPDGHQHQALSVMKAGKGHKPWVTATVSARVGGSRPFHHPRLL
ncbi:hypothetical protein B0H12DRAFT_1103617, partial [Mycena haematopus]